MYTKYTTYDYMVYFSEESVSTFMPDRFNDWMMGVTTKTLLKQEKRKAAIPGCVRPETNFLRHSAMRIAD
jgi:hypothetical protein